MAIGSSDLVLGVAALAAVAMVIVVGVVGSRRGSEQVGGLQKLAKRRGWTYAAQRDELARLLPGAVFRRGERRQCRHLLRGSLGGVPATAFDYSWAVPSGTRAADGTPGVTTFRLKVLLLELPDGHARVSATPHELLEKLRITPDGEHLPIGHPELDAGYRVESADPETARAVLTPLAGPLLAREDQALELDEHVLLLYRPGIHDAADLDGWLTEVEPAVSALLARSAG